MAKKDTPIKELVINRLTSEQYKAAVENGEINGAFFGTLNSLVERYENRGVDFSDCKNSEEKLAKIEQYEKEEDEKAKQEAEAAANRVTAEDRIAAALEYSNLLNSPIINDDDPDLNDEL